MAVRNYSSNAVETALSGAVTDASTSMTISAATGFPATPFVATVDAGAANQEVVLVTGVAGTTLTVTRGYDSTTASAHEVGAVFQHSHTALDFREANDHINNTSGVHGVTGDVVGTAGVQTLTGKTIDLTDNTVTGTKVEFNAAMSDADFLTTTDAFLGAWDTHTPTVTPSGGAFGSASGTTTYRVIGKTLLFRTIITVTTVGTATGPISFTLPVAPAAGESGAVVFGRETTGGKMLQGFLASSSCTVVTYDNTMTPTSGNTYMLRGHYETA